MKLRLALALCLSLTAVTACGDDGVGNISIFDASPRDASAPDAFVCSEPRTACGEGLAGCVDTEINADHCGGCDSPCDSPAIACSGGLCGSCPTDFVPDPVGSLFSQIFNMGGTVALSVFFGDDGLLHVVLINFDADVDPIATDIDLSMVTTTPLVGIGYDVDQATQSARSQYAATAGTLRFDTLCATQIAGTMTDLELAEFDLGSGTFLDGGCTLSVPNIVFEIGDTPCGVDADAGPMADAGPVADASL